MNYKIIIVLIAVMVLSGCIGYVQGISVGSDVKTTLEYNNRMNQSYEGKVIEIKDISKQGFGYNEEPHYIFTVYNKKNGSKQSFEVMDLVLNED